MLRRLVETTRRAEIVALVNEARSPATLAATVTDELCEALDAEIAFVVAARGHAGPSPERELIGSVGLSADAGRALCDAPEVIAALAGAEATAAIGPDLLGGGLGVRAATLAPAFAGGADRALVGVARLYGEPFAAAEVALVESVARSTGHALERTWLTVDLERHAMHASSLARAAKLLNASLRIEHVLDVLCREVAFALGAEIVVVFSGDERGLVARAAHGAPESFLGFHVATGEGLVGRAVATDAPATSSAYRAEGHAPDSTAAMARVRAALAVPLHRLGKVDGALFVGYERERAITPDDAEFLSALAELAAVARTNADRHAEVERAATFDSLTGCLNHAALQVRLREEISRAERLGEPLTVVLVDLENFKAINETHGHLAGDTVLRSVGELLRGAVRLHDQVARNGGDEFALLLPATEEAGVWPLIERAVAAIAGAPLPGIGALHAHVGAAQWLAGEQANEVLARADQELRAAKRVRAHQGSSAARRAGRPRPLPAPRRAVERRMKRLATAASLGTRLSRLADSRAIARAAVTEVRETLGLGRCTIVRVIDGDVVSIAAAPPEVPGAVARRPQDDGAIGRALRERRAVLVTDATRDPLYAGLAAEGAIAVVAVPLYAGTDLWGAIELRSDCHGAFDAADAQLLETVADYVGAALRTADLYEQLEASYLGIAAALAAALEAKDDYTADHGRSVADLAVEVGRRMGMDEAGLRDLRYGAVFHDIGKIAIPDAILHKPGALTADEFEIVKRHPVAGEQILAPVPFLAGVRRIVRHDHERWDGAGYPDGLRGNEIPLGARIVFAVDAFHAMVSDRPYRQGMDAGLARRELREHAGTQFDPDVVEVLLDLLDAGAADAGPAAGVS